MPPLPFAFAFLGALSSTRQCFPLKISRLRFDQSLLTESLERTLHSLVRDLIVRRDTALLRLAVGLGSVVAFLR